MEQEIAVWIVQDFEEYRQVLSELIDEAEGMRCDKAFGNNEEALSALQKVSGEEIPQVLVLDTHLSRSSGIEILSQFKALQPQIQIVILTIRDDDDSIFEAVRAGASGYLLKHIGADKIIEGIRVAAQGSAPMSPGVAKKMLALLADDPSHYGLTRREKEVLTVLAKGYTSAEIADRLFISRSTVATHIRRIYEKLHVHSSAEAVAKVFRAGLISSSPEAAQIERASPEQESLSRTIDQGLSSVAGFNLWVDPGTTTAEDLAELYNALSDLHRAYGGVGVIFRDDKEAIEVEVEPS